MSHSVYFAYGYLHRNTNSTCYMFQHHVANLGPSIALKIEFAMHLLQDEIYKHII